jgi:diaminopimelate epimerase
MLRCVVRLRFSKMHGQGNDFVVIDGVRQRVTLSRDQVRAVADRHFGIGCDQLLLVEPAREAGNDFRYRIWNADGGEVEQCGNGARCFARFVRDEGLTAKDELRVETARGVIRPRIEPSGQVTVDMGPPRFEPAEVPFDVAALQPTYTLLVGGRAVELSVLSMGNPHAVQIVTDVDSAPVATQGPLIENHPAFPNRVNAGYLQVVARDRARLRVWERGAGETLACGTGACAAVVAGIRRGLLDAQVRVTTRGGDLVIRWEGEAEGMTPPAAPVMMTGDAVRVFEGEIELQAPGSLETPSC